jgi:type II secretory pathway pseudopilin PulG
LLLEVIVALAILAVAGMAALVLTSEAASAVARTRAVDRNLARASALLHAVALWPREDLDRHLGDRPQGPWRMRVDRAYHTLYVIEIADSATGAPLLKTTLYRAEPPNAPR